MLNKLLKFFTSFVLLAVLIYTAYHLRLYRLFGPRIWPYPEQVPINLLESANNDGIAWEKNPADGNFDSPDRPAGTPGSSYPADLLPETGAVFTCKALPGVHFLFPNKLDGMPNNVACAGQAIEVPIGFYDKLYILGAAENGRQEDAVILGYEDGLLVTAPLRFSDWGEPPVFGELVAFCLDFRFTSDAKTKKAVREAKKVYLWIQEIPTDPARKLAQITLPVCPRIHIFCMTLAAHGYQHHCRVYAEDTAAAYAAILSEEQALFFALQDEIARQKRRLSYLRSASDGRFLRESRWVEQLINIVEGKMPTPPYATKRTRLRGLQVELEEATRLLDSLLAGKNPFPTKRGVLLKCFLSEIDGSLQPYSLNVPIDYTGAKPYPLVVSLHGHGWYAPYQGHPAPAVPGAICLSPHGRGSIDYFFIAEDDVLSAIRDVQNDYNIDPNRIYLMGHSMGGTGSWNLGVRFPDMFAAIAPNAGNANHKVWRRAWGWRGEPDPPPDIGQFFSSIGRLLIPGSRPDTTREIRTLGDLERYIADSCDPVSYAVNLCNLPAYCIHGEADEVVPVGHARSMTSRLKALGYTVHYVELPGVGHGGFPAEEIKKQREWLLAQVRNPKPPLVRFRTNKLRYRGAYWLYIDAFITPVPFAEIEGRVSSEGLEVSTQNVQAFSVDLARCPLTVKKRLRIMVNGKPAYEGEIPKQSLMRLALGQDGQWAPSERPVGLFKRPNLEGPIEDAFMSPFLIVYGTAANSSFRRWIVQSEAERFAADWKRMYVSPLRIKPDTEVTDEDIQSYNLILYGGPDENTMTARVMRQLPIAIEGDTVRFGSETFTGENLGVKFCYPNPLNEERYVVVFAGTTWQALFQITNRFGNWFNWGVYDNRNWFDFAIFDDRTISTDTFLVVGFFDTQWKLDPSFIWRGDPKKRQSVLPRVVPTTTTPTIDIRHLTDMLPVLIDQHKGPVNIDRSFEGRIIHIGGKAYKRGLGIRAPSIVEFDLDGKFESLHVVAGIDLEGEKRGTEARTKFEAVTFSVYGDGKRLFHSGALKWYSPPAEGEVKISGVKRLRLVADASGARWHLGSAAWGDLRLTPALEPTLRTGQ